MLRDKKPSVLLRQTKELAQNSVTDEFLKTIWVEWLPAQTQAILSESTEKLAELADKINELKKEPSVCKISLLIDSKKYTSEMSRLQKQLENLASQFSKF